MISIDDIQWSLDYFLAFPRATIVLEQCFLVQLWVRQKQGKLWIRCFDVIGEKIKVCFLFAIDRSIVPTTAKRKKRALLVVSRGSDLIDRHSSTVCSAGCKWHGSTRVFRGEKCVVFQSDIYNSYDSDIGDILYRLSVPYQLPYSTTTIFAWLANLSYFLWAMWNV